MVLKKTWWPLLELLTNLRFIRAEPTDSVSRPCRGHTDETHFFGKQCRLRPLLVINEIVLVTSWSVAFVRQTVIYEIGRRASQIWEIPTMCNYPANLSRVFILAVATFVADSALPVRECSGGTFPAYAQLVAELDAATQEHSAEIIARANALSGEFASRLAGVKRLNPAVESAPGSDDLIDLVQMLGEVSARLAAAEQWAAFALRDERLKHYAAKREVKARNLEELRRAYMDYQWQLAARQVAAHQLWQLTTGRARVVATETYSNSYSMTRNATREETWQFANQLREQAYARINVRPPQKTRLVEIYDIQRLAARSEEQMAVKQLSTLVDQELKEAATMHLDLVRRAMTAGGDEQRRAVMSLGWWNGLDGRQLLKDALANDSKSVRQAAVAALGRWHHNSLSLAELAKTKHSDVRKEAAWLAGQQVQDVHGALRAIRDLYMDEEKDVRGEAYRTLDQLARLGNLSPQDCFCFVGLPLKSTSTPVVLDAVSWLVDCGDNSNQTLVQAKLGLLSRLQRHRDGTIRAAVRDAFRRIYVPSD